MKYFLISSIICTLLLFCSCTSISLNQIEQKQLKEYIEYSNSIIEKQLSKDINKRERLQPYRTRYRLIQPLMQRIDKKDN